MAAEERATQPRQDDRDPQQGGSLLRHDDRVDHRRPEPVDSAVPRGSQALVPRDNAIARSIGHFDVVSKLVTSLARSVIRSSGLEGTRIIYPRAASSDGTLRNE